MVQQHMHPWMLRLARTLSLRFEELAQYLMNISEVGLSQGSQWEVLPASQCMDGTHRIACRDTEELENTTLNNNQLFILR